MKASIWQVIAHALESEGISHVFGLPGGDLFFDALYDVPAVKPVLVREESSGAFMAMAWARPAGKPGVCYASSGPGVANLIPGLMEAESACVPLVALGGASSSANAGMGAFQEADQLALVKPVTKWCVRIDSVERAPWTIRRAISLAANGRPGPVFIEVPKNLAGIRGDAPDYVKAAYPLKSSGDPTAVESAARMPAESKRPLMVAGGGAISSRAYRQVAALADALDMPVMTTPCGRGILPEDHRLAFGQVGLYFNPVGEEVYSGADLILTVGSRNEDFQSGRQQFFPKGARYIQIDIDPLEIGRNWIPDTAIVGDAGLVLDDLLAGLTQGAGAQKSEKAWTSEHFAAKVRYEKQVATECLADAVPVKTKRVMRELNQVFGCNTVLVNENGSQDLWAYYVPYYKVLSGGSCIAPGEQTCMGCGVAGAIGAKLARPQCNVVCTTGDGAFQMFMKELPTAVQYGAPVTYVVLDNAGLGWIKFGQKRRGDRYIASDFTAQPDFAAVARASGCYGERVDRSTEIKPALERALQANSEGRPAVLDFIVDGWDFAPGFKRYYERLG